MVTTKLNQQDKQQDTNSLADQLQLNCQPNDQEILECRRRITGQYPRVETLLNIVISLPNIQASQPFMAMSV